MYTVSIWVSLTLPPLYWPSNERAVPSTRKELVKLSILDPFDPESLSSQTSRQKIGQRLPGG